MNIYNYFRGEILRVEYPDGDWFIGKVVNYLSLDSLLVEDLKTGKQWPAFNSTKLIRLIGV